MTENLRFQDVITKTQNFSKISGAGNGCKVN